MNFLTLYAKWTQAEMKLKRRALVIYTSIIKLDCFVTISWQQTNSLYVDMATHALAMYAVAYKYSISKSRHVTFINKFVSWYFLYDQQVSRALISGKKVGCG